MTIPVNRISVQKESFIEADAVANQPGMVVLNPDGSSIGGGVATGSVTYNDNSFVAGDSPATHDINTDLSRNSNHYLIANTGAGSIDVEISHDGTTFLTAYRLIGGSAVSEDNVSVDSIRVSHTGVDTSYFVRAW